VGYLEWNDSGISGRYWSWDIWNGIIMEYLEGSGHGIFGME